MKTIEQVKEEIAFENLYPSWDKMIMHNPDARNDFEESAMKSYAGYKIDEIKDKISDAALGEISCDSLTDPDEVTKAIRSVTIA